MRHGMRRVHGLLALGVCSVVSLATRARAESYRMIEPTLEASEIEHGHLEEIREGSWEKRSLLGLWLVGGASELGFGELNRELAGHGWSSVGSTAPTFGIGGTFATGFFYGGLVAEGERNGIAGPQGESGSVGVLRASWQLGWHAYSDEALSLMPFLALGIGSTSVLAKTADPDRFPLFSPELRARVTGNNVHRTSGLLEIGIGAQTLAPIFGGDSRNGPAFGVQLGFRTGFAQSDWRMADTDLDVGDPGALQAGVFVRLLIGWAWAIRQKHPVFERVDRCAGPRCLLACDRGFDDCDFDPRNGCECRLPPNVIVE
jgi:hypothetical protein